MSRSDSPSRAEAAYDLRDLADIIAAGVVVDFPTDERARWALRLRAIADCVEKRQRWRKGAALSVIQQQWINMAAFSVSQQRKRGVSITEALDELAVYVADKWGVDDADGIQHIRDLIGEARRK